MISAVPVDPPLISLRRIGPPSACTPEAHLARHAAVCDRLRDPDADERDEQCPDPRPPTTSTTRPTPPDIPFPTTFTVTRPPVVIG